MPKLKSIKIEKLEKLAKILDFVFERQKGSHKIYKHADGRMVIIPFHSGMEINAHLLNDIIKKELKISREEFFKLLEEV